MANLGGTRASVANMGGTKTTATLGGTSNSHSSKATAKNDEEHLVKTVFSAGLQRTKNFVDVFSAQGKDPTHWWHFKDAVDKDILREFNKEGGGDFTVGAKQGLCMKYEPVLRGLFITLSSHATLPKPPLRLNLVHPYIVFQCLVPAGSSGFRCSLTMTDESGQEKIIFFSSMLKNALLNNPLRKCLPLPLQTDVWMNLVIDMGDLMSFFFEGDEKRAPLQIYVYIYIYIHIYV